MAKHLETLRAIFKPWYIKVASALAFIFAVIEGYDALTNQFSRLPKMEAVSMSWFGNAVSFLPWWGWLLVLQMVFVYALFEYVRRNIPIARKPSGLNLTAIDAEYQAAERTNTNLDLVSLLHFNVDVATYVAIKRLVESAPKGEVPLTGDADHKRDIQTDFRHFIRDAENLSGGETADGPLFHEAMQKADSLADDELARRLTKNHELTTIMNQLREVIRLEKRRDVALEFLRWRLRKKEEEIAQKRNDLIKSKNRRSPP